MPDLNHIAIAVPDLESAIERYRAAFGVAPSAPKAQPEHGVRVSFFDLGAARIELLEPFGENSPIASFLQRNPRGGIHHICLGVDAIDEATEKAEAAGARALGEAAKPGAHGTPVRFLHPSDLCGVLFELEEK